MGHDGCHIDNAAVAGALHVRHKGTAGEKDTGKVRVLYAAPLIEREIRDVLAQVRARVIDQNLDFAGLRAHLRFQRNHLIFLRHVGNEDVRGASLFGHLSGALSSFARSRAPVRGAPHSLPARWPWPGRALCWPCDEGVPALQTRVSHFLSEEGIVS